MNVATVRRPNGFGSAPVERKPVPSAQDTQLQALLKDGWQIDREGTDEVRLTKPGGRKLTHKRRRA